VLTVSDAVIPSERLALPAALPSIVKETLPPSPPVTVAVKVAAWP
jgi:hypothetical protein